MSLFSHTKSSERFGVIIEIGSGSALVAVIASDSNKTAPEVLWSKREAATLREIKSLHESSKSVLTALVNILLEFETSGRQALENYSPGAKIDEVQCTIAAPWSYTINKRINYQQEDAFEITNETIENLIEAAEQQTAETLKEHEVAAELGLTIVSQATLHTVLNGYVTKKPIGKKAETISLVHTSVVVHSYLIEALMDIKNKMFSDRVFTIFSSALTLTCVARDLLPAHKNLGLVDVTYEATELSIIRDGILSYVTHTPHGLYSLARELAKITGDPLHETYMHLYNPDRSHYFESQTKAKQDEIAALLSAYTDRLEQLLKETGDELATPRNILLHTDAMTENLFTELLTAASKRAVKISPVITNVTSSLLTQHPIKDGNRPDTAMLLAANFFHHGEHCIALRTL